MNVFVAHKSNNSIDGMNSTIISVNANIADALNNVVKTMCENECGFYEFEQEYNNFNGTIEDFIRSHRTNEYHWSFDTGDENEVRDYFITEIVFRYQESIDEEEVIKLAYDNYEECLCAEDGFIKGFQSGYHIAIEK